MRSRTLSVTELNTYIKGVFEDELVLHNLNVEGEIYEFKQTNGTTFLTLREKDSLLACVCFAVTAPFAIGDKVSLSGRVRFYERNGKVSFVFDSIQKVGVGTLLTQFNALRDKLQAEGLFDNRKAIPAVIRRIAVITSETGAVIHDFCETVHRKRRFTDVYVYNATVQGKTAVLTLIERIREADACQYDLIVLARGGGSVDDLSVFNEEALIRAIAACNTPTLSAVGHETDFTLCDFAATVRMGTPSMAGEYISRRNEETWTRFVTAMRLLEQNMREVLTRKTNVLYQQAAMLSYKSMVKSERIRSRIFALIENMNVKTQHKISDLYAHTALLAQGLRNQTETHQSHTRVRLESAVNRLNSNNPLRMFSMGYAKLYRSDGGAVTYESTNVGDEIRAMVQGGTITAKITEKKQTHSLR